MTTTRWWLVRHAPVVGVKGRIYGADDVACDTSDSASFAALAGYLPADAIWLTSHLSRARKTYDAIRAAGLAAPEAAVVEDLGEQSFGHWQGKSWSEMEETDPETYTTFWDDPTRNRPPGGESFHDQIVRVGRVLDRATAEHAGRNIVAISHGGTVRAALSHALELPPETGMAFSIDTLSLTVIEHIADGLLRGRGGVWRIVHINKPARESAD